MGSVRLRRLLFGVLHEFARLHARALGAIDRPLTVGSVPDCAGCDARRLRIRNCLAQASELTATLLDCADGWSVAMGWFDAAQAVRAVADRIGAAALEHVIPRDARLYGNRQLIEAALEVLVHGDAGPEGPASGVGALVELSLSAQSAAISVAAAQPRDGDQPALRHRSVGLEFVQLVAALHGGHLELRVGRGCPEPVSVLCLPLPAMLTEGTRP